MKMKLNLTWMSSTIFLLLSRQRLIQKFFHAQDLTLALQMTREDDTAEEKTLDHQMGEPDVDKNIDVALTHQMKIEGHVTTIIETADLEAMKKRVKGIILENDDRDLDPPLNRVLIGIKSSR